MRLWMFASRHCWRGLMGGFGMAVNPELLYPPIELAHVAGLLEREGHEVAIHDSDALGVGPEGAFEAILQPS